MDIESSLPFADDMGLGKTLQSIALLWTVMTQGHSLSTFILDGIEHLNAGFESEQRPDGEKQHVPRESPVANFDQ